MTQLGLYTGTKVGLTASASAILMSCTVVVDGDSISSATRRDLPRINAKSRSLITRRSHDHLSANMAENMGKGRIFPNHHRLYLTVFADDRAIVWFDIDNTLYSASTKISQAMGKRIHGSVIIGLG